MKTSINLKLQEPRNGGASTGAVLALCLASVSFGLITAVDRRAGSCDSHSQVDDWRSIDQDPIVVEGYGRKIVGTSIRHGAGVILMGIDDESGEAVLAVLHYSDDEEKDSKVTSAVELIAGTTAAITVANETYLIDLSARSTEGRIGLFSNSGSRAVLQTVSADSTLSLLHSGSGNTGEVALTASGSQSSLRISSALGTALSRALMFFSRGLVRVEEGDRVLEKELP